MSTTGIEVEFLSGPRDGEVLCLSANQLEVGRDQGVHLQLCFDRLVSRRHARITRSGDRLSVEDLDSSYGTTVDGERISGTKMIHENNIVCFGHTELSIRVPDVDSRQAAAEASTSANG